MKFEYIEVKYPFNFNSPFKGDEFTAVTITGDNYKISENDHLLCLEIIKQNCRYTISAGFECSKWDDAFDFAYLELNNYEVHDYNNVMTTWHENETLNEIAFFIVNCANFDNYITKNVCILLLGKTQNIQKQLDREIKTQLHV